MRIMLHGAHVRVRVCIVFWHLHPCLDSQLRRTALAEVQVRQTCVIALGPRVGWGLWIQVKPHIAELIDPTHEVTISVGIATALTAAHGNAHDVAYADLLHCGEGCDLTIVDDFQWHITAKILAHPRENVNHLCLINVRWNTREDVTPSCLIVCTDSTCSTATHAINLGKSILCNPQSIRDHLVMVVGVWVCHIPLSLLGIQYLSIFDSHGLDVAFAEIEGQAAAVGDLAADLRRVLGGRKILWLADFHREWN
mmetsp:Transcript_29302/g.54014  ORF Transcript_29302/g.54014 Transcript_29302/m.54014 type:complete len:253 (-) Transcript_29302:472-1230(-)